MCTSLSPKDYATMPGGKRRQNGEIVPRSQVPTQVGGVPTINATDIPLGDGLTQQARQALMSRRERLRIAVGD